MVGKSQQQEGTAISYTVFTDRKQNVKVAGIQLTSFCALLIPSEILPHMGRYCLSSIRMQAEQTTESKLVNSTPSWPLY